MVNAKTLSFALFPAAVLSVTVPGFPIAVDPQNLGVTFGSNLVAPAGELIPRPDTLNPPNITSKVFPPSGPAILMMIDRDAAVNNTRVQVLHWLVTDVTLSANTSLLIPGSGAPAPWVQPSPPVGDIPHEYTILLFPQPKDFAIPASFHDVFMTRIGFNISKFVKESGLQQPALAADYFYVQNLTGSATQTFPPPRATATPANGSYAHGNGTGYPEQYEGRAVQMVLGGGVWAGLVTAIAVGVAAFAL